MRDGLKVAHSNCFLVEIDLKFDISGEMAYHGHRVKIYDRDLNALNSAYKRIEEDKKNLRDEGLMLHKNYIVSALISQ